MNVSASRSVEASLLTKWSVETKFVAICVDLKIKENVLLLFSSFVSNLNIRCRESKFLFVVRKVQQHSLTSAYISLN